MDNAEPNARRDGGLVFPGSRFERAPSGLSSLPMWTSVSYPGMTLRDYFAAKAMQGLIVDLQQSSEEVAAHSYRLADAMLNERAK